MIGRLLCSTGAFSRDPDITEPDRIVHGIRTLNCDGYELIFYPSFYERLNSVCEVLRPVQKQIRVLHTEKSIGPLLGTGDPEDAGTALHRLELNAQLANRLGVNQLVLHLWGLPESDLHIERNLSHFDTCLAIAASHDCQLTVESIPCLDATPLQHLKKLAETYDRARFTLDSEFLAMHDELTPAIHDVHLLMRTQQMHLKDFGGSLVDENGSRIYLHPGQGDIDFVKLISEVNRAPNKIDLSLESTSVGMSGDVDLTQVQADLDFISDIVTSVTETND